MTTHYFESLMSFECDGEDDSDESFDEFTDRIMDALCDLEDVDHGIVDPDMSASITNREVRVLMGVDADTRSDAIRIYAANIRTALHAAGCGTAGWPELPKTTELRELESA